jgi:hypothetical protein
MRGDRKHCTKQVNGDGVQGTRVTTPPDTPSLVATTKRNSECCKLIKKSTANEEHAHSALNILRNSQNTRQDESNAHNSFPRWDDGVLESRWSLQKLTPSAVFSGGNTPEQSRR